MGIHSIFQEAFTAPSSARDIGQEMLHATLLLSCAFVGWCASSVLVSACGWFQNCPDEHKAKEGSSIFREEVAAYVQANNLKGATKHFGLSCAEILKCLDTVEHSQCEAAWWKVGHIWQLLQDAVVGKTTQVSATEVCSEDVSSEDVGKDICKYSIAPAVKPGMILLEQYGVFGASSGTWSGPMSDLPSPRHRLQEIDYSVPEDDKHIGELEKDVPVEQVEVPSFACSHGYGVPSDRCTFGSGQYSHDVQGRIWVPLEYTW